MDMAFLLDRLEALAASARRLPFGMLVLNEQELTELLDQMRVTLPNEVNEARRVVQERGQIIGQAQAEAAKIVGMARDRAEYALTDNGLLIEAKATSEQLLVDSRKEAMALRADADSYVAELLTRLETLLENNLHEVRGGLSQLVPDGRAVSDRDTDR